MFTTRHYRVIAHTLRMANGITADMDTESDYVKGYRDAVEFLTLAIGNEFTADNPRFRHDLFVEATK